MTAADRAFDQAVRGADPDRWLASRFIADPAARADVVVLYAFDHELARAGRVASNALIAEIRLTWWREVLDEIFGGKTLRAHPTATRLAHTVQRRALPREPLEAMIDARIGVLNTPKLALGDAVPWADGVGGSATLLAARVLDPASPGDAAARAGRVWGLVLLRRAGAVNPAETDPCLAASLEQAACAAGELSASAFPAVVCATLARDDLRSRTPSELVKRLRLFWAMARGRL